MKKLEKEVKILNIDIKEMVEKLKQVNAEKVEECIQKMYVYDLPSIYSRFIDCIAKLENIKMLYEYEVCRNKLNEIFYEIDNLTTIEQQNYLQENIGYKTLIEKINKTEDNELLMTFSKDIIVDFIKKFTINPYKWVRLRETNKTTTIAIKHILKQGIEQNNEMQKVIETEMEVPSIEETNRILEQLGFSFRNYQEKYRIKYDLDGVEVDIDLWPLIPPYLEIEADSNEAIYKTIEKLDLNKKEIVSCNTVDVYKKYGLNVYEYRNLKFEKEE